MRWRGLRIDSVVPALLLSRVDGLTGAGREHTQPDEILRRRALAALCVRLEAGDRTAIGWIRQTVDLSFDTLAYGEVHWTSNDQGRSAFSVESWLLRLERAIETGRVLVEVEPPAVLPDVPVTPPFDFPSVPATTDTPDTFFDVRFVDEVGQAINGLDVEFDVNAAAQPVTTNPAGVALLENVVASAATVAVPDPNALDAILDPRWQKFRPGKPPKLSNTTEIVFDGDAIDVVPVKPAVPQTVVIKPPLGKLYAELWDRCGRVRHANRDYTIDGPMQFGGTTDAAGRLSHDAVFPGDYTLSLTVTFAEGDDQQTDVYQSPLLVLAPSEANPEVRLLGAVPRVVLARLRLLFDTGKAFLLPSAMPCIRDLREIYRDNVGSKLLVVGHTDSAGSSDSNDSLALARAKATIAFLDDDVDGWLAFYDADGEKRWGDGEDRLMLMSMLDFVSKPSGDDAVSWYQQTRHLQVDGVVGPQTRRQLVTEYMSLDGASLSDEGIDIEATAHGCGSNFPMDGDHGDTSGNDAASGGDESDADDTPPSSNADSSDDDDRGNPADRRVELFFFDSEFGILPAPPGDTSAPGSTEYPAWRKAAAEIHDLAPNEDDAKHVLFVEMVDAFFRTNSPVVLPEGEAPSSDGSKQAAFTSVGAIATALRFNEGNDGKKVFVSGHTDTAGAEDFNQELSVERAKCTLALLTGGDDGREAWKQLCDGRHRTADYKQILAWATRAFSDLAFDCDPGSIDDDDSSGGDAVSRFQQAYNANKSALAASGPDLDVDGVVGPQTWGAIFDCYEFALRRELGVDAAGIEALREKLCFVDDDRRALGFGEHFPVDELGSEHFRSQANRRAEILFFDFGEEPDLKHAEEDPETSEVYLPGYYVREAIDASSLGSARRIRARIALSGVPLAGEPFELRAPDGVLATGTTTSDGLLAATIVRDVSDLTVVLSKSGFQFTVVVGTMEPASDTVGAQRRLAQLGYFQGPVDGQEGDVFDQAILLFQRDESLSETGSLDQATRDALVKEYGS